MSIADKLIYVHGSKQALKDAINAIVGSSLESSDDIRNYAAALSGSPVLGNYVPTPRDLEYRLEYLEDSKDLIRQAVNTKFGTALKMSDDMLKYASTMEVFKLAAEGYFQAGFLPGMPGQLFQDTAMTVPITAMEQPVAAIKDMSGKGHHMVQATTTKRPVVSRRVNLLTNSGFAGATSGAPGTAPSGWANATDTGQITDVVGGLTLTASESRRSFRQTITAVSGQTITAVLRFDLISGLVAPATVIGHIGTNAASVSYEINGAYISAGATLPPGNDHELRAVFVVLNSGAFILDCGIGVSTNSTGAVRLISASFANATDAHLPYQWVNTPTDYDADPNKFPTYLRCDGVDDAMQSIDNIDLSYTDKVMVWAGILVSSSSDQSGIFELGVNSTTSNGLSMQCMGSTFTTLRGQAFGTSRGVVDAPGFAPNTAYQLCAQYDLSAALVKDEIRLRKNGAYIGSPTLESSGTGNFSSYPLTIMARGYMATFTGGRLYGLLLRGGTATPAEIESSENLIAHYMRKTL